MTVVPNIKVISAVVVLALVGAFLTLVHRPAGPTSYRDSGSETDIAPALSSLGVLENPPLDVTVNGQKVPLSNGTTTLDTGNGTATVTVSGNSASVDASSNQNQSDSTPSDGIHVTVESHTSGSGGSSSSSFSQSSQSTSSSSSNFSQLFVSGQATGHVEVNTH